MTTVALAQVSCSAGQVRANVDRACEAVGQAAESGAQLVILPEMLDTGYDMKSIAACAGNWDLGDDATPLARLSAAARSHRTQVICGLSERAGEVVYNSCAVLDDHGQLAARYRKTHLFSMVGEQHHLGAGNEVVTVKIGELTVGTMICYDLRFPEFARTLALAGADLLTVIAAWPTSRIEHWQWLGVARAVENQLYVAAVNRVGDDGGMDFGGHSRLIDPLGQVAASADHDREALITADIDPTKVARVRDTMRIRDDRRPELYRL